MTHDPRVLVAQPYAGSTPFNQFGVLVQLTYRDLPLAPQPILISGHHLKSAFPIVEDCVLRGLNALEGNLAAPL